MDRLDGSASRPDMAWVPELCHQTAESLWAAYRGGPNAPRLIFPVLRTGKCRVSEQESKILITQWLDRRGLHYSVETPTVGLYRQTGITPMSARVDVTVYGSSDPANRVLNIELKQGTPKADQFAKDIEKLLVEAAPGLWFHTVESADARTWAVLAGRVRESLTEKLPLITQPHPHLLHFAFCVLRQRQLVEFDLDVSSDWAEQLLQRMRASTVVRSSNDRPRAEPEGRRRREDRT